MRIFIFRITETFYDSKKNYAYKFDRKTLQIEQLNTKPLFCEKIIPQEYNFQDNKQIEQLDHDYFNQNVIQLNSYDSRPQYLPQIQMCNQTNQNELQQIQVQLPQKEQQIQVQNILKYQKQKKQLDFAHKMDQDDIITQEQCQKIKQIQNLSIDLQQYTVQIKGFDQFIQFIQQNNLYKYLPNSYITIQIYQHLQNYSKEQIQIDQQLFETVLQQDSFEVILKMEDLFKQKDILIKYQGLQYKKYYICIKFYINNEIVSQYIDQVYFNQYQQNIQLDVNYSYLLNDKQIINQQQIHLQFKWNKQQQEDILLADLTNQSLVQISLPLHTFANNNLCFQLPEFYLQILVLDSQNRIKIPINIFNEQKQIKYKIQNIQGIPIKQQQISNTTLNDFMIREVINLQNNEKVLILLQFENQKQFISNIIQVDEDKFIESNISQIILNNDDINKFYDEQYANCYLICNNINGIQLQSIIMGIRQQNQQFSNNLLDQGYHILPFKINVQINKQQMDYKNLSQKLLRYFKDNTSVQSIIQENFGQINYLYLDNLIQKVIEIRNMSDNDLIDNNYNQQYYNSFASLLRYISEYQYIDQKQINIDDIYNQMQHLVEKFEKNEEEIITLGQLSQSMTTTSVIPQFISLISQYIQQITNNIQGLLLLQYLIDYLNQNEKYQQQLIIIISYLIKKAQDLLTSKEQNQQDSKLQQQELILHNIIGQQLQLTNTSQFNFIIQLDKNTKSYILCQNLSQQVLNGIINKNLIENLLNNNFTTLENKIKIIQFMFQQEIFIYLELEDKTIKQLSSQIDCQLYFAMLYKDDQFIFNNLIISNILQDKKDNCIFIIKKYIQTDQDQIFIYQILNYCCNLFNQRKQLNQYQQLALELSIQQASDIVIDSVVQQQNVQSLINLLNIKTIPQNTYDLLKISIDYKIKMDESRQFIDKLNIQNKISNPSQIDFYICQQFLIHKLIDVLEHYARQYTKQNDPRVHIFLDALQAIYLQVDYEKAQQIINKKIELIKNKQIIDWYFVLTLLMINEQNKQQKQQCIEQITVQDDDYYIQQKIPSIIDYDNILSKIILNQKIIDLMFPQYQFLQQQTLQDIINLIPEVPLLLRHGKYESQKLKYLTSYATIAADDQFKNFGLYLKYFAGNKYYQFQTNVQYIQICNLLQQQQISNTSLKQQISDLEILFFKQISSIISHQQLEFIKNKQKLIDFVQMRESLSSITKIVFPQLVSNLEPQQLLVAQKTQILKQEDLIRQFILIADSNTEIIQYQQDDITTDSLLSLTQSLYKDSQIGELIGNVILFQNGQMYKYIQNSDDQNTNNQINKIQQITEQEADELICEKYNQDHEIYDLLQFCSFSLQYNYNIKLCSQQLIQWYNQKLYVQMTPSLIQQAYQILQNQINQNNKIVQPYNCDKEILKIAEEMQKGGEKKNVKPPQQQTKKLNLNGQKVVNNDSGKKLQLKKVHK